MARLVGVPCACAVLMVLDGRIIKRVSHYRRSCSVLSLTNLKGILAPLVRNNVMIFNNNDLLI